MNVQEASAKLAAVRAQIARRVIGQDVVVEHLLVALVAGGHVLLEGAPGLAKTLAVKSAAAAFGAPFARVQFTPDLLPSDVVGSPVYREKTGEFEVKKGPVFTNFLLADEINRAPAKVQSALLQAMEERQVTIGDETFPLPKPFFVLATQNPIENEGTYALPEAQLDRFLLKVKVGYPSRAEERRVMENEAKTDKAAVEKACSQEELLEISRAAEGVYADEKIFSYALSIVEATRQPHAEVRSLVAFGASPRASIALIRAARARALILGREYVVPEDVKALAPAVLRHRLVLSFEALGRGVPADEIVEKILARVAIP